MKNIIMFQTVAFYRFRVLYGTLCQSHGKGWMRLGTNYLYLAYLFSLYKTVRLRCKTVPN